MATETAGSDMGVGLALAFTAVTLVGVWFLFAGAAQITRAWGFAFAMLAATIAVVGLHAYEA